MKRPVLLTALLAVYAALLLRLPATGAAVRLDPLEVRPRSVEQAMSERRFSDALPVTLELHEAYPGDPLTDYWLATIYQGLDRPADEVTAWTRYISASSTPAVACPALPLAYERLGQHEQSLLTYEHCAEYDPRDPQKLIDLAAAWEKDQNREAALTVYRRAALLDPSDPLISRHIRALTEAGVVPQ